MAILYVELDHADPQARYDCETCGKSHMRVWSIQRRRVRTLGHYCVFRINGEEVMYDPSLPRVVARVPFGAVEIDHAALCREWHDDGHYFGSTLQR